MTPIPTLAPTVRHELDQVVEDLASCDLVDTRGKAIMEELRKKLSQDFGITVVGPYMTLRWSNGRHRREASFQLTRLEATEMLTDHDPEYNK